LRRIVSIIAGAGALVIGMSLSAWAHGKSNASSSHWSAFVDEDGDGIHDSAARAHWMRGRTGKSGAGPDLRGVALTPEQQTQINQLKSDYQKAAVSLQATLQTRQIELRDLMRAAQPDQNAINAKIDEINAARAELQKEMTSFRLSVRALLTPEQRAALDAARFADNGRGHGFRGKDRGHRDKGDECRDEDDGHRDKGKKHHHKRGKGHGHRR